MTFYDYNDAPEKKVVSVDTIIDFLKRNKNKPITIEYSDGHAETETVSSSNIAYLRDLIADPFDNGWTVRLTSDCGKDIVVM